MINLPPVIDRIKALLAENTEQSVTYAALESRLALEKVCYDRLRQAHDYISHAQLRRWQPGGVIKTLVADVGGHVTDTLTLYISKGPAVPGVEPAEDDWVEVGTQVGFDGKRIGKLWNALSGLALHVRLPESKDDHIPEYGDREQIRAKVQEALTELERLSKASMVFSGIGEQVSFDCDLCGEKNKRRARVLREGQSVFCINPECKASWRVRKQGDEFVFEGETADFTCQGCGEVKQLPWRFFFEMRFDQRAVFECRKCDHRNYVEWRLTQVAPQEALQGRHEGAGGAPGTVTRG
ncbi:MAG TPA: hypothetical protein VEW71_05685 [Allosphingosinicella sp.]|nr:hypothetical protein [Allosphingosinicella sp.]